MRRTESVQGTHVLIDEPDGVAPLGTVLMLHGWPDSAALWDGTVAALCDRWRCVRFTLPGYEAEGQAASAAPRTLDGVTALIAQVLDQVSPAEPVTLLLHDWGCIFGYHFARVHPQRVVRVIGVDIGDAGSRAHRDGLSGRAKLGIVVYQVWLALAGAIGGGIGRAMALRMARAMRVAGDLQRIRAAMSWPYIATWTGRFKAVRPLPSSATEPAVPMLYLYGAKKPFQFHSDAWARALAARPGCAVHGVRSGHWVMLDAADEFHAAVRGWLEPSSVVVAAAAGVSQLAGHHRGHAAAGAERVDPDGAMERHRRRWRLGPCGGRDEDQRQPCGARK